MSNAPKYLWWTVLALAVLLIPAYQFREPLYRGIAMAGQAQESWWALALRPVASLGFWVLAAILIVLVGATWRKHGWTYRVAAATAPFLAWTMNLLIKGLVKEPRPCEVFGFDSLIACPTTDWSWPSGHSAIAAALATGCILLAPRIWPLAAGLALAFGYLRVLMGVHYAHDVVAGWLVGVAFTLLWFNLLLWALNRLFGGQSTTAQEKAGLM